MPDARYHRDNFAADYVRALASAVGLPVRDHDPDSTGVDLGIRRASRVNRTMTPGIDVRACASWKSRLVGAEWHFAGLTDIQFNRLAGPGFLYPRFLFLVRVPDDRAEFATVQTDGMVLRQLGYYRSLEREPKIVDPDPRHHPPIHVPLSNVLTERSLVALIDQAAAEWVAG